MARPGPAVGRVSGLQARGRDGHAGRVRDSARKATKRSEWKREEAAHIRQIGLWPGGSRWASKIGESRDRPACAGIGHPAPRVRL